MTNKELKQAIKDKLQQNGFDTRPKTMGISVRNSLYDISVRITIRDITLSTWEIEKVVNRFEQIRYDEYCGEILAGCNTYVNVEHDYENLKKATNKYLTEAKTAIAKWNKQCERGTGLAIASAHNKTLYMHYDGGLGSCSIIRNGEHCSNYVDGKYNARNEYSISEALFYFYQFGSFRGV